MTTTLPWQISFDVSNIKFKRRRKVAPKGFLKQC
jgi:hypothetical protein